MLRRKLYSGAFFKSDIMQVSAQCSRVLKKMSRPKAAEK